MGQYYMAVCVDTEEWIDPHDYNNGAKLMEHSYLDTDFTGAVMTLLLPGGSWHKKRIVWAGDYGDKKFKDFAKSIPEKLASELNETTHDNIYGELRDKKKLRPDPIIDQQDKFIVNHDDKTYIDLGKIKSDGDDYKIHPLPLLTADGNGRGGGDYGGSNLDLVGSWAGNRISVEFKPPKGYKELIIDFDKYVKRIDLATMLKLMG